jgi:hypothetical protein
MNFKRIVMSVMVALIGFNPLFASSQAENNSTKKEKVIIDFSQAQNLTLANIKKSNIYSDFLFSTGFDSKTADKFIKQSLTVSDFKKALLIINHPKIVSRDFNKKTLKAYIPNYEEVLKYIDKALKKQKNPFIAYFGLNILINNYMAVGPTQMSIKYINPFSKVLYFYKTPIGYLYYAKGLYKFGDETKRDYKKAYSVLQEGVEAWKKLKKDKNFKSNYLWKNIRLEKAKLSVLVNN